MPLLQMHPEDASRRNVEDGDAVVVWNDRGRIELTAKVSEAMLPGTVISQGLWWDGDGKKQRANSLTSNRLSDMGNGATFFSATVEVKRQ
ncbi:Dimethyl sulfoxide reductase DmsA precursor [compost metagenome]